MLLRLCAIALVAGLGVIPAAPPEHVHEVTDADGHHEVIAHRHVELHGPAAAPSASSRDVVDHPDPVAIAVNNLYTAPDVYSSPQPDLPVAWAVPVAVAKTIPRRRPSSDQLIHAPPRAPASLRAPPDPRHT